MEQPDRARASGNIGWICASEEDAFRPGLGLIGQKSPRFEIAKLAGRLPESFRVTKRHSYPTMKNRLLVTVTAILLAVSPVLRAADEPKTPLGEKMESIDKAFKAARAQINEGKEGPDTLAQIAAAKAALKDSVKLQPKKTPIDHDKYVAGINAMIALFDKLEASVKAKTNEESKKILADIAAAQRGSHREFRAPAAAK